MLSAIEAATRPATTADGAASGAGPDLYQRFFRGVHGATSGERELLAITVPVIQALEIAPDKALSRLYDRAVDVVLNSAYFRCHQKPGGNPP